MFRKIFTFSNATLLVALTLSTIAAWYSIVGLTAIFAGAVIPIIIMGSALELGKIATTVWLRKYWKRASWILKAYLVPAVFFLAVLTSMGIFGFLSKAHMDQGITSGDAQAKLALYDEKIRTQRETIELARKALQQMDAQVDARLSRGDSEAGAERAVQIRRQQQGERAKLQKEIGDAQKEIAKLNEERAPIAAETRKIEAEVGPIKYIAALIYGDNPDQNVLERAVRWVIILLVAVFDPLALMLVIAANQSKEWDKEVIEDDEYTPDPYVPDVGEKPTPDELEEIEQFVEEASDETLNEKENKDPHPIGWMFKDPGEHPKDKFEYEEEVIQEEPKAIESDLGTQQPESEILAMGVDITERPGDYLTPPQDTSPDFEGVKINGEWVQTGPAIQKKDSEIVTEGVTQEAYKNLPGQYVEYQGKRMRENVLRSINPNLLALREDSNSQIRTNFGTEFPKYAIYGDVFVRVDALPNRVYKFNGTKWIEQNKDTSDSYLSDEYIKFLIQKIDSGEYDIENLSEVEQDSIQQYLNKGK